MSYIVLARKYRPMFFEDVKGQEHVTRTLQNAIEQNRIANAYLFCGPRGVGKTTVARLLAKALNCEKGVSVHPCNECSSCIEINESRSLDVLEIDGASNRGIDEVRNLRESLHYTPNPGKYRIIIIDEVHMLTNEAFNALLKTLEEPPPRVLFIFATTEAHKVPATIVSRCQQFDFKRMSHTAIIEQLKLLCQKENITIDDESLRLIATKADGSMRDSQSILDQVLAYCGTSIQAKDTAALLGIIDQELFFQVTDLIYAGDAAGGIQLTNRIYAEGYDCDEFLLGLQDHIRNFLLVKTTGTTDLLNVSEEQAKRYLDQIDRFSVEDLLRLEKIALDASNLLKRSTNARLHFELAILKMIKMARSAQLGEIVQQLQGLKKKFEPLDNSATKTSLSRTVSEIPSHQQNSFSSQTPLDSDAPMATPSQENSSKITLEELQSRWPEITVEIKKRKIALGSFLDEGWPFNIMGNQLHLVFDAHNGFHMSAIEKNRSEIEEILYEIIGFRFRLLCVRDEQGTLLPMRTRPSIKDKKSEFDRLMAENETVKKIVKIFDAEFIR